MYFKQTSRTKSEFHPLLVSVSVQPTADLFGRYLVSTATSRPHFTTVALWKEYTDANSLLPMTVGSLSTLVPSSASVCASTRVHERDARWRLVGGRQAGFLQFFLGPWKCTLISFPFWCGARGRQESSWISPPCCWDLLRPPPPPGPPRLTCAWEF